jgi:hypothetical protein
VLVTSDSFTSLIGDFSHPRDPQVLDTPKSARMTGHGQPGPVTLDVSDPRSTVSAPLAGRKER